MTTLLAFIIVLVPSLALAAGGSAAGHHGNPAPSIDLAYRAINFFILVGGLVYLLKKPLTAYFSERSAALRRSVDESKVEHDRIMKEYQEIKEKLSRIDAESRAMVEEWKADAVRENQKIKQTAQEHAIKLKADAKKIVASEVIQANEEMKLLAIGWARESAEKMIRDEITPEDDNRMADRFVERLGQL